MLVLMPLMFIWTILRSEVLLGFEVEVLVWVVGFGGVLFCGC